MISTDGSQSGPSPSFSGGVITNVQLFAYNSHGAGTRPLVFFLPAPGPLNLSARLAVGIGDNVLIGGFIITGNAPKKVLLRAIGPSLPVPGALADPILELHDFAGTIILMNDNWRDFQETQIEATKVAPTNENESALIATLPPLDVNLPGSGSTR